MEQEQEQEHSGKKKLVDILGTSIRRVRQKPLDEHSYQVMNLPEWNQSNVFGFKHAKFCETYRAHLLNFEFNFLNRRGLLIYGLSAPANTAKLCDFLRNTLQIGFTSHYAPSWLIQRNIDSDKMFSEDVSWYDKYRLYDVLAIDGFGLEPGFSSQVQFLARDRYSSGKMTLLSFLGSYKECLAVVEKKYPLSVSFFMDSDIFSPVESFKEDLKTR